MSSKHTFISSITGAQLYLIASNALAEDSIKLNEMVVSAAGYQQTVAEAPASITVIDRETIQQGAYRDITEVLSHVPGVFATGGASGKDISIRGMPTKYTLLLVDGRPQSSRESQPSGAGGMDQEWLPPLSSIERIEVIRGPMSTLYGANAMGGVINIITRQASDTLHGNLGYDVTSSDSNDFGTSQQGSLFLSGPLIDDKLSFRLGARYLLNDEDNVLRGAPEKEIHNYNGQLRFTPNKAHTFDIELIKSRQNRITTAGKSLSESASDGETNNEKETLSIAHTGHWGALTDNSYLQHESTYNEGREIRITNTVLDSRWVIPFADHTLTLGTNFSEAKLKDDSNVMEDSIISNDQYSLYAEDEWLIGDSFALTGGLRTDKNENFGSQLSPRLYANWFLNQYWTIKAGAATGYQTPELRQMTENWVQYSRGGNLYGNSELQPETSLSQEVGLIYSRATTLASITIFDNQFDDKIVRTSCPTSICSISSDRYYVNIDEAKTQGVEISTEWKWHPSLSMSVRYTYTKSEQLSGDNKGQPLTQMPKHLFASSVKWALSPQAKIWLDYEYRGEESMETGLSSNTEIQAPSYDLLHIGTQYQLSDAFTLQAGINNLLDQEFSYDEFGFVDSSRAYWASLEYQF
ncbi:TonB-dependent receptor domain-containing protein [Marinomonas pollencensis]|uniref:Outer membrane receptor for ferrienterochelin and colicins n=1 Tax=Marinomonas pollencensis TaxID=491954 RepID=A0A3E0DHH3_9GAMM|nr:TonB-dependent receptor [Marinomonas pollencensis]REG82122.1 outer membrane receptor for ferrienterochelin and colicins [Marinomonas pollencensis]